MTDRITQAARSRWERGQTRISGRYVHLRWDELKPDVRDALVEEMRLTAADLDASDIAAGLDALNTPIVATWPEVRDRLGLGPKRGDRVTFMDAGLDEVFVHEPVAFHLEYMANNQVWMRVDRVDQPAIVIWLTARGKITGTVQED